MVLSKLWDKTLYLNDNWIEGLFFMVEHPLYLSAKVLEMALQQGNVGEEETLKLPTGCLASSFLCIKYTGNGYLDLLRQSG